MKLAVSYGIRVSDYLRERERDGMYYGALIVPFQSWIPSNTSVEGVFWIVSYIVCYLRILLSNSMSCHLLHILCQYLSLCEIHVAPITASLTSLFVRVI